MDHPTKPSHSAIGAVLRFLASEPYRFFFPLGVVAGLIGVALWPLWLAGWLDLYPGVAHARIMMEGFFAAFVLGFLGTAAPRMLEVPTLSPRYWGLILFFWGGGQVASLLNLHDLAELGFALALLALLGRLAFRLPQRQGLPPPGFVMVLFGLFSALLAAFLQMPSLQSLLQFPYIWAVVGRYWMIEAFILLPILGITPFFIGRFGGLPPRQSPEDLRSPDAAWRRGALIASAIALSLLIAITLKALGWVRTGALLQAGVTAAFIWTQVPFRYPRPVPTLGRVVQLALVCLVLAPLLEVFWPGERLAWRHLLLIPGFQFVLATVGTWVIFAHAGRKDHCLRPWKAFGWISAVWLLVTLLRMAAEASPRIYESHLLFSALGWILASVAWLVMLTPRLREDG